MIAPGREGADWLTHEFAKNKIGMVNNAVDVGVRVELPAPVFAPCSTPPQAKKITPEYNAFVLSFWCSLMFSLIFIYNTTLI